MRVSACKINCFIIEVSDILANQIWITPYRSQTADPVLDWFTLDHPHFERPFLHTAFCFAYFCSHPLLSYPHLNLQTGWRATVSWAPSCSLLLPQAISAFYQYQTWIRGGITSWSLMYPKKMEQVFHLSVPLFSAWVCWWDFHWFQHVASAQLQDD